MFINRLRDRIKIIWCDRDVLAIFMKRSEVGIVQKPSVRRKCGIRRAGGTVDELGQQHQASSLGRVEVFDVNQS